MDKIGLFRVLYSFFALTFWFVGGLTAQTGTQSPVLITFNNGTKITKEDFEYVYQKNNGGYEAAKKHTDAQFREYLQLFVKFKRKVLEAEAQGIDTTTAFKSELTTYLKQLAQPYLIEKDVLNAMINEAVNRSKQAIKVSHILLRVEENAMPDDTVLVYKKIMAIRDSIVRLKIPFAKMADRHTDDPGGKGLGGYLSYFTAFNFVFPFEDAAYKTAVGQVTMPVRTKFGYHLILVHEKVPAIPGRTLSHILIRHGASYPAKDSVEAQARANQVYDLLKKGGDFAKLAAEYSNDPNTKTKGGELGSNYIAVTELNDIKYKLANGEISKPFKSKYGIHIVKVNDPNPPKKDEDLRAEAKAKINRDGRIQIAEDKLVERLKKDYKYTPNQQNIDKAFRLMGPRYLDLDTKLDSVVGPHKSMELFSYANQKATLGDLIAFAQQNTKKGNSINVDAIVKYKEDLDLFAHESLLAYEESQLSAKYPEYRNLMREYRDGILLFTLTEAKVWRKAVEDTTGLKKFYEKNKEKYPAGERVRYREYRSRDSVIISKIDSLLRQKVSAALIDTFINKNAFFQVRVNRLIFEKTSENGRKLADKKVGFITPVYSENSNFVVQVVEEFVPAGFKSFEEARSECITQYQNTLEEQWLAELEKKYPYTLNDATFKMLFK